MKKTILIALTCAPLLAFSQSKKGAKQTLEHQPTIMAIDSSFSQSEKLNSISNLFELYENYILEEAKDEEAISLILTERHLKKFITYDKDGSFSNTNDSKILEKYQNTLQASKSYLKEHYKDYRYLILTKEELKKQ